jgi:quercetin dioxygenase-like cupin family protein
LKSKVVRAGGALWPTLPVRAYKDQPQLYRDVLRRVLLGGDEAALNFEVRYFEVGPGGFTTLESHQHAHAVIVLRGRGEVRLGDARQPLAPFDAVYVAPGEPHQFRADPDEVLGFLCVVDRDRDRPIPLAPGA